MSRKDIMVIASVENRESSVQALSWITVLPIVHAPSLAAPSISFVTSEQLRAMSDKWAEQFARFEVLR